MTLPKSTTFTCEHCGGVFQRIPGRTDADVIKEYEEAFSEELRADPAGYAVICDDCHQALLKIMAERGIYPK